MLITLEWLKINGASADFLKWFKELLKKSNTAIDYDSFVECPHCERDVHIHNDNDIDYASFIKYQQKCEECGETFTFTAKKHFKYQYHVEVVEEANNDKEESFQKEH